MIEIFFILAANLFTLSIGLDIHYPEHGHTGYGQAIKPYQYMQYETPYQHGMNYQGLASDDGYNHYLDYHRPQYSGHVMRRSPTTMFRQVTCPHAQQRENVYRCYRSLPATNSPPVYPFCNTQKHSQINYNQGSESIPIERDSRSALKSSKMQIDYVSTNPPIIIPINSSNTSKTSINIDDAKNKRAAQDPPTIFYQRRNKNKNATINHTGPMTNVATVQVEYPPSNSPQSEIVAPSRKYVPPITPGQDTPQARFSSNRGNGIYYSPEKDINRGTGVYGQPNNNNMLTDNARSSGSYTGGIYKPNNYPGFTTYRESQKSLGNIAEMSTVPPVYPGQPSITFLQQPNLNDKDNVAGTPSSPHRYLSGARSANSLPLRTSPSSNNNGQPYPVYTPNMGQNNSKYPQIRTSY